VPALPHSPAQVIQQLIADLSLGTDPLANTAWPVFASGEPSKPDNVLTITDTTGLDDGRVMQSGELLTHYGFQVRIRAVDHATGWAKADAIRTAFAESVYQNRVTLDATHYLIWAVTHIGQVLALGKDTPSTKRSLFTLNATVTIAAVALAPLIASASLAGDYLSGNQYIALTGSRFTGTTRVRFGANNAGWFAVHSDTELHIFDLPFAVVGSYPIVVTNASGDSPPVSFAVSSKAIGTTKTNFTQTGSPHGYYSICSGPDGALWWPTGYGQVWKMTPAGVASSFTLDPNGGGFSIIVGPGGNLWTCGSIINGDGSGTAVVWKITPLGVVTPFTLLAGSVASGVSVIAVSMITGADGRMWVIGNGTIAAQPHSLLWAIDDAGIVTTYLNTVNGNWGNTLCAGPDGNVWLFGANPAGPNLFKFSPVTGAILNSYSLSGLSFGFYASCVGPDGLLWAVSFGATYGTLLQIDLSGNILQTVILTGSIFPRSVCVGPDGNFYVPDCGTSPNGALYKVTTGGVVTSQTIPSTYADSFSGPLRICVGPDGLLYIVTYTANTDPNPSKIVQVS
jgi:hypothetical protein